MQGQPVTSTHPQLTTEIRMSKENGGFTASTLIAFAVAGMAFTASLVLAYYVTHPDKVRQIGQ